MASREKGKKISRQAFKRSLRIFSYIAPYKWYFIIGLFCLLISSLSSLAIFSRMGSIIDIEAGNFLERSVEIIAIFGILLGIQAISSYFRIHTFAIVTENAVARIRQDVYAKLITLPMAYFSDKRVGELSSRISNDISSIQSSLTTYLAELIRQVITIIGVIIILSASSYKLALFMLATLPAMAIFAVVFGRKVRKLSKKAQQQVGESNTIIEETLQGIAAVKAFSGELFEIMRYRKVMGEIIRLGLKNAVLRGLFASVIVVFIFGAIIAIIWFGSLLVSRGEITSGQLFEFLLLSVFMAGSVGGLADTYAQIQKSIGATENVLDILEEKTELTEAPAPRKTAKLFSGNIRFDHVNFSYPSGKGLPVLKDISFEIKPGEQVAIVGPSGAGKSTLTALLLRFYHPSSGKIWVDGKDALDFDLAEYRSQIALVPQDIVLFGGTIMENIRYGRATASDAEVMEAAKKANAHAFIENFPDQYQTVVGERGTKLSGGQRQRIAIARAMLSDPAILILDEATSSLDSESEKQVQDALTLLMAGRTSFVIAHRLSTIRAAHKIIVLDQGKIRETGTHQELIKLEGGLYRYLSSLQFEKEPEEKQLTDHL